MSKDREDTDQRTRAPDPPLTSVYDAMRRISRLETALQDLVQDLEDRAQFDPHTPNVVACGDGVYRQAKAALGHHDGSVAGCVHCTWDRGELVQISVDCPVHKEKLYRAMEEAPKDGTPVYLEFGPVDIAAYWDLELGWVTTREYAVNRIGSPNRWRPYGRQG